VGIGDMTETNLAFVTTDGAETTLIDNVLGGVAPIAVFEEFVDIV
jgi:hypothetical protein